MTQYTQERTDLCQGSSLPPYCPDSQFGESAWWSRSDHLTKLINWFKHILFMTEHDKGLGRAKKLCLALSKLINCALYHCRAILKISYKSAHNLLSNGQIGDPDCDQNLITCTFYHPGPLHKVSVQSIHNILSNVANRQKNRQTNTVNQKHGNKGFASYWRKWQCAVIWCKLTWLKHFSFHVKPTSTRMNPGIWL